MTLEYGTAVYDDILARNAALSSVSIIMGTVIIFIAIAPVFKSILTKMTSKKEAAK